MKLRKNVLVFSASLLFASSVLAEDYTDTIVQKHGKAISIAAAGKKLLKTTGCNKKQIALVVEAKVVNISDMKENKKPYLLVSSDDETTEDDLTAGPLSNIPTDVELKKLVGKNYCVLTFGGCKKFCVNGHKAGNCRHFERSRNDRSKSPTRRADRQPAVWI